MVRGVCWGKNGGCFVVDSAAADGNWQEPSGKLTLLILPPQVDALE
jgi:hypothetical protein